MKRLRSNAGYSLVELMVVMAVMGVLAAFAIPVVASTSSSIKLRGQAEDVSNLVGLAKMRATARFSKARVFVDQAAQTFVLQIWDSAAKKWVNDNASATLPFGVTFSYGKLADPPPETQDEIKFAAECTNDAGDKMEKTSCINFNSRGIPIDSAGVPVGGNAFYLTDGTGVRAVTVTATPLIRDWWSSAAKSGWVRQ
jgi:prepilin-type N-terminal cleavage/methylation domain-containing protein